MPTDHKNLLSLLWDSVNEYPDREAIVQGKYRITYRELWQGIYHVQCFLLEHGVKPGDRVAIVLENSPQYVMVYYGILASGGVVVSLNISAKSRDIVNWLNHSGSSWIFLSESNNELHEILNNKPQSVGVVVLKSTSQDITRDDVYYWDNSFFCASENNINFPEITGDMPAAIIYTSGTTGRPKGVTLSHKNLYSNIKSILDYLGLTKNDRIVNVLPFYYSYGNSILHTHLAVGGCLILENSMLYPHLIIEQISKERATGFSGVPSTYALLLNRVNLKSYDLKSLQYMTQAGGPMAPAHIERLTNEIPYVRFFVMYGQTEATARLTYLPPEKLFEKNGSVGIPIPGVCIEVRMKNGDKAKPGEIGEICAKGNNIMLGYWNDKNATRDVIKDGWLKTGDLASLDEDGYIYICGRSTDMIKSGANRISPKEIEEVISEIEDIHEVAVIGKPDSILGEVIHAYVVLKPDSKLEKSKILSHCKSNLASYKIPKGIEFMESLPKTASGKIQRFILKNHK